MSEPTPRTDAVERKVYASYDEDNPLVVGRVVDADFARQLERELYAAEERAAQAEAERDALRVDAERYLHLKRNAAVAETEEFTNYAMVIYAEKCQSLDAAIDAARQRGR